MRRRRPRGAWRPRPTTGRRRPPTAATAADQASGSGEVRRVRLAAAWARWAAVSAAGPAVVCGFRLDLVDALLQPADGSRRRRRRRLFARASRVSSTVAATLSITKRADHRVAAAGPGLPAVLGRFGGVGPVPEREVHVGDGGVEERLVEAVTGLGDGVGEELGRRFAFAAPGGEHRGRPGDAEDADGEGVVGPCAGPRCSPPRTSGRGATGLRRLGRRGSRRSCGPGRPGAPVRPRRARRSPPPGCVRRRGARRTGRSSRALEPAPSVPLTCASRHSSTPSRGWPQVAAGEAERAACHHPRQRVVGRIRR